jgi:hypothetical protein
MRGGRSATGEPTLTKGSTGWGVSGMTGQNP